jgi:hypothetical protein
VVSLQISDVPPKDSDLFQMIPEIQSHEETR